MKSVDGPPDSAVGHLRNLWMTLPSESVCWLLTEQGYPGGIPGPLGVCTGVLFQNTFQRVAGGPFGMLSKGASERRLSA